MKKERPLPWYIKEDDGSFTKISTVIGVSDEREHPQNPSIGVVAALFPEYVITRKEFDKQVADATRKRYEERFKPIIDAFGEYGKLTPQKLSQVIKIPEKGAKETLERFYRAGFAKKIDDEYTMTAENVEDINKAFGIK